MSVGVCVRECEEPRLELRRVGTSRGATDVTSVHLSSTVCRFSSHVQVVKV